MTKHIGADGTELTDELVSQLADEADAGFTNSQLTGDEPSPWRRREPMETHSIRVPARLWELLEQQAAAHNMTTSEFTRQALTQSLLTPPAA